MKKSAKSANMYVMFGLLAVLFLSLGYLSMQGGREGMSGESPSGTPDATPNGPAVPTGGAAMPASNLLKEKEKQPFQGGREGMASIRKNKSQMY
jgi:hypothetical protein